MSEALALVIALGAAYVLQKYWKKTPPSLPPPPHPSDPQHAPNISPPGVTMAVRGSQLIDNHLGTPLAQLHRGDTSHVTMSDGEPVAVRQRVTNNPYTPQYQKLEPQIAEEVSQLRRADMSVYDGLFY